MKTAKTFSLEVEDVMKFEKWIKLNGIKNHSQAFRLLLKTAGVIEEAWYQIEENHLLKKSKKKHVLHAGTHVERTTTRMIDVLGAIADIIFTEKDEPGTTAWENQEQPGYRAMPHNKPENIPQLQDVEGFVE